MTCEAHAFFETQLREIAADLREVKKVIVGDFNTVGQKTKIDDLERRIKEIENFRIGLQSLMWKVILWSVTSSGGVALVIKILSIIVGGK